ncbi:unnamed protein product [Pleuronectes platessa]|uniref:Uncharacterized protein n=1 Tax=Pleuronectes platessa TaxID=8262 RepID=A0A9N7Z2U2_PLEPL|nr:unnamed protein product [Pleuronectes platessa]
MFVTILFGDSRMEIFNLNCKLIHFIRHVKERCGLDFKECVDLMDSSGSLMNLEDKQHSVARASSMLVQRQYYVLLHVCRKSDVCPSVRPSISTTIGDEDTGGRKYVSLLNNHSQSHPELTELLRKLTNPNTERDRQIRGRRRFPVNQTRSKNISANNKSHRVK